MRKKKEILATAAALAGELGAVCDGSRVKMGGEDIDVAAYAHGAAVALGLLVTYALGEGKPTLSEVLTTAVSWSKDQAESAAEHPERVTSEVIDLRDEEADHE